MEETPTQKQIRLRRERREAKIKAGGSARLDKITSLTGRPPPAAALAATASPPVQSNSQISAPTSASTSGVEIDDDNDDADPEEVDISNHRYTSAATKPSSRSIPRPSSLSSSSSSSSSSDHHHNNGDITAAQEAEFRRLLRGEHPSTSVGGGGPNNNNNNMENLLFGPREGGLSVGQGQEDDMNPMRMLEQLMGGDGAGLQPGMAAILGKMISPRPTSSASLASAVAGGLSEGEEGSLAEEKQNDDGYLWKIVHAVFALGLGIYITAMTTFSGAKSASSSSPSSSSSLRATTTTTAAAADLDVGGELRQFFWVFATVELVLQSTRFFLEKGRATQSGWVGVLMGVLPEPYKGYLALGTRYGGIYTTVVQDAMAVLFVLGCVAWWKGAV